MSTTTELSPMAQLCASGKGGVPPSEFNLATYPGRLAMMREITSPMSLLTSVEQQEQAKATVLKVHRKEPGWDAVGKEQYYAARRLYSAVYHPDTNEALHPLMRFSAFLPANIFILLGMLHPSQHTSTALILFWQWANQTYNVVVNYANRNISSEMPMSQLALAYTAACGSAMGFSALGNRLVTRMGPSAPAALKILLPFGAVATAAIANVGAMRASDLTDGVALVDAETREPLPGGNSTAAGRVALTQVMVSRAMVPFPLMTFPPLVMLMLGRVPAFQRATFLHLPANVTAIALALYYATPACLAVFPPESELAVGTVEPRYSGLKTSDGRDVTTVLFNKGL